MRFTLIAFVILLSCEHDPRYCDKNHLCTDPRYPFCDVVARECESALARDMGGDSSAEPDGSVQGHCHASSECPSGQPICDRVSQRCRACESAADDVECAVHTSSLSHCELSGPNRGQCGQCNPTGNAAQSSQCDLSAPICAPDGTCRACQKHEECSSGICALDLGTCIGANQVLYVNNQPSGTSCASAAPGGSATKPYCEISAALNAGAASYIRVASSSKPYGSFAIHLNGTNVTIVGPGLDGAATVSVGTSLLAQVDGNGTATIDGLDIEGKGTLRTVYCDGSANAANANTKLVLLRSFIRGSRLAGVSVNSCDIELRYNFIFGNAKEGLYTQGSLHYNAVNNFIIANGNKDGNPGVTLSDQGNGNFSFNTLVNNGNNTGPGGIDCGAAPQDINSSIVVGNSSVMNTQFRNSCTLTHVVTGSSDTYGGSSAAPIFVNGNGTKATDFKLDVTGKGIGANQGCCIDQVSNSNTDLPLPSDDFFGVSRPQGSGWDIGAHEAQ